MSSPPAQSWRPHWKSVWRRFYPGSQTRMAFGSVTPNLFCSPQILLCSEKFVLNIRWKQTSLHPKNVFCPPDLNLATGLVLPKLCLQLGYFVSKAIWPRDVAERQFFLLITIREPCKNFWGGPRVGLIRHCQGVNKVFIINPKVVMS